ncbi:MAG: heavy-metal-associated domain-containing protein, partial [Eubacterium sp.]
MKNIVLNIEGMSCNACELRIENAVSKIEGVETVKADCEKNTLTVEFDLPATVDKIKNTVQNTGYDVVESKRG